ncbi:iron ABC transporter substrate-binding protein [soil metagenome]
MFQYSSCDMAVGQGRSTVSRRTFLATGGAGIGVAAFGRLAVSAQESGGEVTVYSGRNENLIGPVLEQFQEALGITVTARYGDTAEMSATILEEGDNSPADVFLAQDAGALGAIQNDGRFSILSDDILERVDAQFRSDDGQWVGLTGRARVAVYNTEMLTALDLPLSVEALVEEQWKDQVGWAPTNGSFQAFVTAFRVLKGEEAAAAWLEGMAANGAVTFEGNGPIVRAVGAGELPVGLVNHYYLFEIQAEENQALPIANHFFEAGDVGSLVNVSGIGILNTAKNVDQAQQLVDYLLSEEAQTYFAQVTSEYPLIEGVEPLPDLRPLDEIDSPEIDLSDLSDLQGTLELLAETGIL